MLRRYRPPGGPGFPPTHPATAQGGSSADVHHAFDAQPEGVQTIKNNPSRIKEVNREVEQLGATVKAQWATLGQFDFVNVVEAPDEKTMARISLELGSRGTAKYETLVAIPIDDFIGAI